MTQTARAAQSSGELSVSDEKPKSGAFCAAASRIASCTGSAFFLSGFFGAAQRACSVAGPATRTAPSSWRWLRSRDVVANCACPSCDFAHDYDPVNRNRRGVALQCAICLKEQRAPETLTFCSAVCFVEAWPEHRRCHNHARSRAGTMESAASGDKGSFGDLARKDDEPHWLSDDASLWEIVAENVAEFVPSESEVGRRLRIECYAVRPTGREEHCARVATRRGARRRWRLARSFIGESTEGVDPSLRVASYNILAEIYATAHAYPYCERWALEWQYRGVIQELIDTNADVICLQEAQRDHFERDVEPAMKSAGYEGLFTQKSREAMGAAARSRLRHNANLSERDEHAYLTRLVKDNVAQLVVLEDYPAPGHRSRRLAMANTHLYSHKDFPDTKLWQSLCLLRALESFANRSRDAASCRWRPQLRPDSSVYELISTQAINPRHPDLAPRVGQFGAVNVLPDARQISHRLPLGSARDGRRRAQFTNYTMGFRGTLDYIWSLRRHTACSSPTLFLS
ncbi:hypothetical protein JL720_11904 [Aureococcus anophagefferens]|nr:hypothetical protein JL720_11904 [Aureococcus anophagefferens]